MATAKKAARKPAAKKAVKKAAGSKPVAKKAVVKKVAAKAPAKKAAAKSPARKAAAKAPAKKAAAKAPARKAAASKPAAKKATARKPNAAFMKALTPSVALASIVGDKPLPRTEVVKRMWDYIKKGNLQDEVNKRLINADDKLRQVFGKAQVNMFEMTGLLGKHLK